MERKLTWESKEVKKFYRKCLRIKIEANELLGELDNKKSLPKEYFVIADKFMAKMKEWVYLSKEYERMLPNLDETSAKVLRAAVK